MSFAVEKSVHEALDTLHILSASNVITMSQAINDNAYFFDRAIVGITDV